MLNSVQMCTFHIGDLYMAVDVMRVQEVIRYQEMTGIPLAPVHVRGLINLRGQIVTALDLRTMLDMEPLEDRQPLNVVVYDTQDDAVSLLVDQIGDVIDVSDVEFEPVPPTLTGPAADLVTGAYKLPDALLLVLDTDHVLHQTPASRHD